MARSWDRNRLLRRAFVASLCLHVLFAWLFPTQTRFGTSGLQPVETISFAKLQRIRLERPRKSRPLPVAIPRTANRAPRVSFARVRAELTANRPKPTATRTPVPQNGPQGERAAAPTLVAKASNAPLAAQVANSSVPVASVARAAAAPNPAASTADRIVASQGGSHDVGGVMPFGADLKEPVLDPAIKTQLARRFSVHVTLLVTVGDDGRTKRVQFAPPIDASVERQIEALLADANWDAAVCGGGITCEAQATIKL